jgi:hypothetical protein
MKLLMVSNVGTHFVTVLAGHIDVGQNDTGLPLVELFDCGIAVAYFDNLKVCTGKCLTYQTPDRRAVVGQKDCTFHKICKVKEKGGP